MIKKYGIILIALLFTLSSSFAAGSVVLNNQNPDPVAPGNFVYLNVKISNPTGNEIREASINFQENDNFELAQGQTNPRNLGAIPPYSASSDSTSFVIAKYKLKVDENTPFGLNTATFEINFGNTQLKQNFDILVHDENPTLTVNKIEMPEIIPGTTEELTIEVQNDNSVNLRNVVVGLNLDEVEDGVFSTKGTNQKTIRNLGIGETREIKFDVQADPNSNAKPYRLPISISYKDALNTHFEQSQSGSIRVSSEPELMLNIDSQEPKTIGERRVSYAIANPGSTTIRGLRLQVIDSQSYTTLGGAYHYIGDLNPDDFQTAQTELFVRDSDNPLSLQIQYSDSYNQKYEEVVELPLEVLSQQEARELGLSPERAIAWSGLFVTAILLAIAFYIGRRQGIKKGRKK